MSRTLAIQAISSASASSSKLVRPTRAFASTSLSRRPDPLPGLAGMFSQSSAASASSSKPTPQTQAEAMLRGMNQNQNQNRNQELEKTRKATFGAGNIIPAHELAHDKLFPDTPFRRRKPPLFGPDDGRAGKGDPFYITKSDPLDHVYNPHVVQAFLDPMGRIRPRSETLLTKRSQKQVGRMVRRARSMGLVSTWTNRPSRSGYGSLPSSGLSLDEDTFY